MAGLNTVFKQVFGEGLKEQGFVKIKGRQPYLVRVIGGEIIHIITCTNQWCGEKGFKEFSILENLATVYCNPIMDLTLSPHANANIYNLNTLYNIYLEKDPLNFDKEYGHSIYTFIYKTGNDISLREEMERALEETKKIMMPFFDGVADLESCADYFARFKGGDIIPPEYNKNNDSFDGEHIEGLLLIKTNNHDDFIEIARETLDREIKTYKMLNVSINPDKFRQNLEDWRIRVVTKRDKIYDNPQIYTAALEELERQKHANIETLRSYGLNI